MPRRARTAAAIMLAAAAASALAACDSGAIGQSGPGADGQSFVSGTAGTTEYGARSGPTAPTVTGTTLTGRKLALTAYRGHVVVLNFWGSWCTPCRTEAPVLSSLASRLGDSGVRFLGVDIRDSPASAQAFLANFHIGYPSLNDPGDAIALDFHSTVPPAGIPTTLVIGPTGRISARVIGEVSYPGLRGLISRAMTQSS